MSSAVASPSRPLRGPGPTPILRSPDCQLGQPLMARVATGAGPGPYRCRRQRTVTDASRRISCASSPEWTGRETSAAFGRPSAARNSLVLGRFDRPNNTQQTKVAAVAREGPSTDMGMEVFDAEVEILGLDDSRNMHSVTYSNIVPLVLSSTDSFRHTTASENLSDLHGKVKHSCDMLSSSACLGSMTEDYASPSQLSWEEVQTEIERLQQGVAEFEAALRKRPTGMTGPVGPAQTPEQHGAHPAPGGDTHLQAKKPALSGAATRSYNLAEEWDRTTGLTEEDLVAIDGLAKCCAIRPHPAHLLEGPLSPTTAVPQEAGDSEDGVEEAPLSASALEELVLQNSHQFYRWHGELEAARTSETEEKYRRYGETLAGHLETCTSLMGKVDQTLGLFDQLQDQHKDVHQKTQTIHDSCEKLVEEKERLVEFADALRSKLAYFDELETIVGHFHSASLTVEGNFLPMLTRLDECITFVSTHPQYADSSSYLGKFRQLQSRALGTIRSRVKAVLDKASAQVMQGISSSATPSSSSAAHPNQSEDLNSSNLSEGAETAILYVRFRAAAEPALKGLISEIEARSSRAEYAKLASELQTLFCEARLQLVGHVVEQRIQQLSGLPVHSLTRNGCAYLMQVCQLEHQLFEQFFPAAAADIDAMKPLLDPMCNILYDTLRPTFITMSDIDQLCELADIIRHEVLQEQLGRRGNAIAPLRPTMQAALQDVQGRLTFRAQAYLKDEVAAYAPVDSDTDYPAVLLAAEKDEGGSPGQEIPEVITEAQVEATGQAPAANLGSADSYALWYPPLQRSLLLLSKVYRCLPRSIFGGIAFDAVASTTASIQGASRAVARRSGPTDGQLYMIKHLLILREQIAPFEAEFAASEKDLDFGHMRDQLRRIMAGESNIFSLSSSNSMMQLMGSSVRVTENKADSKKDLEKLLKATCEAFIMSVTKLIVEPMLSFITKVTAVKVSSASSKPLKEQAFASHAKVVEMIAKVNEALDNVLPKSVEKMRLYLNNPSTHAILFKPIKSNIAEAHGQIAALLESEYSAEVAESSQLKLPDELMALLDRC